jgi:hypothetical protein
VAKLWPVEIMLTSRVSLFARMYRSVLFACSYFEKILADNHWAVKMHPRRADPHLIRACRIIGRDQAGGG